MGDNRSELYEEVRLYRTAREREHYDSMADLYALINTLNCLERAYIKDSVTAKEYTAACSKLLVQYNIAFSQVKSDEFPTIESFMKKFCFECTAALKRIHDGRPITIKDDKGNAQKCIADIVSLFITITDRLRLDIKSMDELQPDLRDLYETMNRLTLVPQNFDGKLKIKDWLNTMSAMAASDELNESQVRQLIFDLEQSYNSFNKLLHNS